MALSMEDYVSSFLSKRILPPSASPQEQLSITRQLCGELGLLAWDVPIITVVGTNGKGSCVSALESFYQLAGYRTLVLSSPHLSVANERIRVDHQNISDEAFSVVAEKVCHIVGELSGSIPFAVWFFMIGLLYAKEQAVDLLIVEAGIGGRYDAVNVLDADVVIVTSISLDHTDLLGPTREHIAHEKAGVFREGVPVVCGDSNPPDTLLNNARAIGAPVHIISEDFSYRQHVTHWEWQGGGVLRPCLPTSTIRYDNLSCVLMCIQLLSDQFPVNDAVIERGLLNAVIPCRQERVFMPQGQLIFDVAHNEASVTALAERLQTWDAGREYYRVAVFSAKASKDIASIVAVIAPAIDTWCLAPISESESASMSSISSEIQGNDEGGVTVFDELVVAFEQALRISCNKPRMVVVFGSFQVVGPIKAYWEQRLDKESSVGKSN